MADQHETRDVRIEKRGSVAWLTIDRPDRYNCLDHNSFRQLAEGLEEIGHDSKIGVIVLTGAGDKAFCAGGYLANLVDMRTSDARLLYDWSHKTFNALRHVPQPVIAAVNGAAIGGGNELVVCSDLAIASDRARFGQAGPRIGSSPIFGGNNLLAISIGEKKAREVCYLCRQYTAQEALELGWINKVVPHGQLYDEVQQWCEELLDKSPGYLELTKASANVWWDMLTPALEHAKQVLLRMAGGAEMREGASAFMEKRKPDFRRFRT
jgi:enoyl-CoA hydratase/carnithine racemase